MSAALTDRRYYSSPKFIDSTGAGNVFLGSVTAIFTNTGGEGLASAHGAVVASFIIKHTSPPQRKATKDNGLWNGEGFEDRLKQYEVKPAT
ncbi:uncharacterized protein ColSpa_04960 [Colletotrichum spaethianum]|uniref:Uncharacterized protein n=1 Tax=Colletotrichum spaethianum TaxID=700344 RepID=A0AA37P7N1_9PEZI|nr:uncharacterized protein ColSpa_04960 [Colletotrichum spaethianum]GKT44779.1 uncharacterized protein ColSpa_04960 [Colletotrichum spaethianum]